MIHFKVTSQANSNEYTWKSVGNVRNLSCSHVSPSGEGQRTPPTTSTSHHYKVNHKHVMARTAGTTHNLHCPTLRRKPMSSSVPTSWEQTHISCLKRKTTFFLPLQALTFNQTQIPLCLLTYQADTGCRWKLECRKSARSITITLLVRSLFSLLHPRCIWKCLPGKQPSTQRRFCTTPPPTLLRSFTPAYLFRMC